MAALSKFSKLPPFKILAGRSWMPPELAARLAAYDPRSSLGQVVKSCFVHLPAHLAGELLDAITSCLVIESALYNVVIRHPDSVYRAGTPRHVEAGRARDRLFVLHNQRAQALQARDMRRAEQLLLDIATLSRPANLLEDYGLVSQRLITNNGVGFLTDAWQNSVEAEIMKYHGTGSSSTAENASDSGLGTEFTTQLNPDSTRATGTLAEAASNILQTVATNTYDAGVTAREHGLFSQAATGGGTLWDRSVYSDTGLGSGDSLQTDYRATLSAGG